MQSADYRLVRSHITTGIMISVKRNVFPKSIDHYFSYWLYGQGKLTEQIPANLPLNQSCLVCSHENKKCEDFSLITVDINLFLRCLPLLNNEQLSILYSLIDDDRQLYQNLIRQQYQNYKQILRQILKQKHSEEEFKFFKCNKRTIDGSIV
jgi:hypothetical protein